MFGNSVLMLYIRRWSSWRQVTSRRNIGWLRPKPWSSVGILWHKVLASRMTGKLCTNHLICGNLVLSERFTDAILTDMVSRQFRSSYRLITTKLIHICWRVTLTSSVILNGFLFELHVIEIVLPNYLLKFHLRPRMSTYCMNWQRRLLFNVGQYSNHTGSEQSDR